MTDTAALAALIVAAAALLIASAQLTQQLLSTAYVIRKCDRIVTGGLTKGGTRQWHWRQFRFTVRYQTLVFALPPWVYWSLGISSTVKVDATVQSVVASRLIFERAVKTRLRRSSAQGCWISLVQDLAMSDCLSSDGIITKEESGDRIPEDLTVAPMRVDSITVLLGCIAMGMQVFKYSPTTGEITLSGGVGSVSSSAHPILGGLLHYSVFDDTPSMYADTLTVDQIIVKNHGRALRGRGGVWANAVFGRFRDTSYRPEMVPFDDLVARKIPTLRQCGWPEDSAADRIGGAACFMVFGHVDVYISAPPSVIRHFNAHLAEIIVQVHLSQTLGLSRPEPETVGVRPLSEVLEQEVRRFGRSSPHYHYFETTRRTLPSLLKAAERTQPEASRLVRCQSLYETPFEMNFSRDPSTYCPTSVMWDLICIADYRLQQVHREIDEIWEDRPLAQLLVERMVAVSISKIAHVGPPSWGFAAAAIDEWPRTFVTACDEAWADIEKEITLPMQDIDAYRKALTLCAEFSILRSAYYTCMMRAAHPLGPGLTEGMSIETSLAYMA
ncbi:MAG: hypothetical protein Q9218_004655 [Villophora microphyllina]